MELAHGLLLNEEALKSIPENKKDIFVYEWLRFLHKVLKASQKSDIKEKQKLLVSQLNAQILTGPGPPTRSLIGHCLSTLYQVGDSYSIYETVSKCNDIVKNKDDSPSYLAIRLSAIVSIGILYENNGRMLGGLFPETVQFLLRGLKNAESQTRCETLKALRCLLVGLGASAAMCHRDVYKVAKMCLVDRSMFVRTSAAQCLEELVKDSTFVFTNEFEPLIQQSIKALEGSTYEVRCAVARMLGCLVAGTQKVKLPAGKGKKPTIEDAMYLLSSGFLQAGSNSPRDLLKGNSAAGSVRHIRVGITEAYVEFVRELGTEWLEKNLSGFLVKVLDIVAQPKATPNHLEAVYSRQCISFILRSTVGTLLGESQQQSAVRELCLIVSKHVAAADTILIDANNAMPSAEITNNQHVLVCATQEIASLMRSLGTAASPLVAEQQNSIITPILSVLLYPSQSARLSASWCLRCIAYALPSQISPLIDRCVEKFRSLKASSDAMLGYSSAVSALIGGVQDCPMGISHSKGKKVFNVAEAILRSVGQSSQLAISRTQAGWLMIGSLMTMGPSVVSPLLPKLMQTWRAAFPRSMRELEQEKQRGVAFTWQLTLESRAGALCAMRSFVASCGKLLNEETIRKLMVPLESAMAMMSKLPDIVSIHGQHLKTCAAVVRLRLYDILTLLPPGTYEGSFNALLRELVAEFTLTDNPINTTTSFLRSLCNQDDGVLLGSWLKETEQSYIEDQLQGNNSMGSGSLEHDQTSVYLRKPQENVAPGPLTLGVSVIDAALALFGIAFPHVAMKHRLQMLKHFDNSVKQSGKNAQRQHAIQINVFTALICALKGLAEAKRSLGSSEVRNAATALVMSAVTSTDPTLRCAAGEAIGRMAQVTNDPTFVAKTAQLCFEKLKTARDVISRTGHSLALGSLHRYVGGMTSGQHLRMSVGILLALAQDSNSPEVQVWALHGLSLIIDAFGPMFRSYVDSSLQVVLTLFLQVAPHQSQVHRCLGRCLSALITTLGPELQGNATSIATARSSCLTSCSIMSHHIDAQVQSESVSCLQQLHMFAPRHVELANLVPRLCNYMSSWHLILRRSAVSCLRQLAQKEAAEVCSIAAKTKSNKEVKRGVVIGDSGLEGAVFSLLDRESDRKLVADARDLLSHIVQAVALDNLGFWVRICKSVLAASTDTALMQSVDQEQQETNEEKQDDDDDIFSVSSTKSAKRKNLIPPRWPTRVFAVELIKRIISMCRQSGTSPTHFDLAAARIFVRSGQKGDFLVLHLSDLVRMAFMAATDNSTQLRMVGLDALQDVIKYFKDVPEPEFQGSVILEQYQANVGAALRPAFSAVDAPHEVTVRACEVCSAWISSGVVSDLSDLKRVHSLLVSSLQRVKQVTSDNQQGSVYSESAATMEKLAVLRAWAEVYISSVSNSDATNAQQSSKGNVLTLVEPHLKDLSQLWLDALRDQAKIKLPAEIANHLPEQGGAFFTPGTKSSVRKHYNYAWPAIVHALSLWLSLIDFEERLREGDADNELKEKEGEKHLHLVLGVCIEALCSPRTSESLTVIVSCLSTLDALLASKWTRKRIGSDQILGIEILNVLHRLLLTRDSLLSQSLVLNIVQNILNATKENLYEGKDTSGVQESGEGGESGEVMVGKSTVFATLEVCMCVLVRHIPTINPTFRSANQRQVVTTKKISSNAAELIGKAVNLLSEVLTLCSPRGSLTVLPSILFLLVGVLREGASLKSDVGTSSVTIATTALQALRNVVSSPFNKVENYKDEWAQLLQSALSSILEFTKEDLSHYNSTSLLTCVSVFLLHAPSSVSTSPQLLVLMLDYFEKCFGATDNQVKLQCLALLTPILRHPDQFISRSFVHRMAPLIFQHLAELTGNVSRDDSTVASECLNILELLVALTDQEYKNEMVEMLVPMLILRLDKAPEKFGFSRESSPQSEMHNDSLQRLMQIGPKFPIAFKSAIASNPTYKLILERALKQNQARKDQVTLIKSAPVKKASAQPTITLKMDFSNFAKN